MANAIYKPVPLEVGNILKDVQSGKIGLPDLQRPFVWKNDKVRDLLDSMLRGYPIGYIMLWESPSDNDEKKTGIGTNIKVYDAPRELVIDGQQRLTALLTAFYGIEVKDKSYKTRSIRIAYDPIERAFKNADATTDRDPRYVSTVSEVFEAKRTNAFSAFRRNFVNGLDNSRSKKGEPLLTDSEKDEIENGLNALLELERYLLPTLEVSDSADEEMVADIFVRVNSQGQALKQDDFIMTLLSVYEPAMREKIEKFCGDSHIPAKGTSYNQLIELQPTHLIRTIVGLGFNRGRLRYAYQILRGRDLATNQTGPAVREQNFKAFGNALDKVLDLNNWHAFINIVGQAGYVSSEQVLSANALMFCYTFYLIGKYNFNVGTMTLQRIIRRWYFACALTAFYVGSFETDFERQLNEISQLASANEFERYFDDNIASLLTDDYFRVTLPAQFNANEATGPRWHGFVAAQVILGAKALFNTVPLSHLVAAGASGTKKAVEKHHLFPDNYLKQCGQLDNRSARANFTYVDYQSNIYISDDAPNVYVKKFRDDMGEDAYKRNCHEHALPIDFEDMDYADFLSRRRVLMAQLVKEGFEKL